MARVCRLPLLQLFNDSGADLRDSVFDGGRSARIALITVTYNSAPVLDDFFASLNHQTSDVWDLIVIDNASSDNTVQQIQAWDGPLDTLIRNDRNLGFATATNQGIRIALEAGYGAVLIINNDVIFGPDFLEELASSPARDGTAVIAPAVRFVGQSDRYWYASGKFTWFRGAFQAKMYEQPPNESLSEWRTSFAPGCCLLIERETLNRVGLFDEQFFVYWEDVDWSYRCLLAEQPIKVVREPTLEHKVSVLTGGGTSPFGARMFHEGQIRFLRKHFPRWIVALQYPLMLAKIGLRFVMRRDRWPEMLLRLKAIIEARELAIPSQSPCVAVNLTAIGPTMVGGTVRYALSLFESMAERVASGSAKIRLEGHVRPDALQHFTPLARRYLHTVPHLKGRVARIMYERILFPARLSRRRTHAVINPIFAGPTRGASRIITVIHDLYFRNVPKLVEPRRRRYLEFVVPRAVRASDVVVTISESTAKEVRSAWPDVADRTIVVHSAGRNLPLCPPMPSEMPYVIFVGTALPHKNVEVIITAIAWLQKSGREIGLLHVGSDPEGILAEAVTRHAAARFVQRIEGASDDELAAAYKGALALVIASFAEGFCLPVLEAQALGTPVCTTPCGALREIAGKAALYFEPDQSDVLASHIASLLDNPSKREILIKDGLKNAARFDWQRTAKEIIRYAVGKNSDG